MVSKARLDLPEPESPVTTMSLSRGISTEMFLRLWTRAPCTAMVVRAEARRGPRLAVGLEAIRSFPEVEEGQLLHFDVAPPGELHRHGGLADGPLVGQLSAARGDAADVEISPEVVLELGACPRLADLAEVIDHRPEQGRCAIGQVAVDRVQRRLDVLPRLLAVEQVGVDRL